MGPQNRQDIRGKPVVDIQKLNLNISGGVRCPPQITWIMQEMWMFSSLQSIDWTSMDWWETSKKPCFFYPPVWWFHRSFYPSQTGKFMKIHLLRGKSSLISQNQQLKTAKKTRSNELIIYWFSNSMFFLFHKLFWVEIHPGADSIQLKATSCLPRLGRGAQQ